MNRKGNIAFYVFIFLSSVLSAQDSTSSFSDRFSLHGYVRQMQTLSFVQIEDLTTQSLIHNRLNFKYLNSNFKARLEVRNRVFYGEAIRLNTALAQGLEQDYGLVDLSKVWYNSDPFKLHSIIDRCYVEYTLNNVELSLGRQRVNWGINLAWNPNDIFNAYNFADFDYQERPGVDAFRMAYYTNSLSLLDVVVKPSKNKDEWIAGARYKFNKWLYDWQFLGALYQEDLVAGMGWAGNIKKLGFKGEVSHFYPLSSNSEQATSAAVTLDYAFESGLYVNASVLWNSLGVSLQNVGPSNLSSFYSYAPLSPKNLMPSEYAYFAQVSGSFSPPLSGSFAVIYLQSLNTYFVMPNLSYTINELWDVTLVGQLFFLNQQKLMNVGNSAFLRFAYSF